MTGPEHYREAERLLTRADGAGLVGAAQAHATLALAAATALHAVTRYVGDSPQVTDWAHTIGIRPAAPVVPDECGDCESNGVNCFAHRTPFPASEPARDLEAEAAQRRGPHSGGL